MVTIFLDTAVYMAMFAHVCHLSEIESLGEYKPKQFRPHITTKLHCVWDGTTKKLSPTTQILALLLEERVEIYNGVPVNTMKKTRTML